MTKIELAGLVFLPFIFLYFHKIYSNTNAAPEKADNWAPGSFIFPAGMEDKERIAYPRSVLLPNVCQESQLFHEERIWNDEKMV
ncbi:MAG: hypothetical protein VB085_11490 [Peptococcaceae bacterium]|nr:hypothetical protein [Peptococcaceae bacterium]